MYSKLKFVVRKDNLISQPGKTERRVRQGSSIIPLLFNILINDIDQISDPSISDPVDLKTTTISCFIYADDVLVS